LAKCCCKIKFKSRLVFGEVIVVSGGRVGTCTVANGRAALTPGGIAEIGPASTK